MNKTRHIAWGTLTGFLAILLSGCQGGKDLEPQTKVEEVVLNVDVILPPDIREQWQNSIDWALENIAKAQQLQTRQVKLKLRWHDEDREDLDKLGYELTHPEEGADTCHAVIGPYHSSNAMDILKYAKQNRLPVLMPTCTSAELQRINARNTYAWFLTESDITQCEMMLSVAKSLHATDVALVHSDDSYGQSFLDWFGYYAQERDIHIAGGTQAWKPGSDLRPFLRNVVKEAKDTEIWVLLAFSEAEDYITACREIDSFWRSEVLTSSDEDIKAINLRNICADTAMDRVLLESQYRNTFCLGVTPSGSMNYGFPQAYQGRYNRIPFNGEAQVYDALTLLALGAAARCASPDRCLVDGKQVEYNEKPYGAGLTDYIRSVVSSESGVNIQWDASSLSTAFEELSQKRSIYMTGATGGLNFDTDTYTKILNTTYMVWDLIEDEEKKSAVVESLVYLSTAGSSGEASTTAFWSLEKQWEQEFSQDDTPEHELPEVTDHWAVVISPSTTWSNYRHQADAYAMYKSLRQHGYDDDHIVLIVEDNLAYDENNLFPGVIYVERGDNSSGDILVNDNVYSGAVVDYHFSQLEREDIAAIMTGQASERLPQVIHPTSTSNVFFFWSGHGGSREGPLWGDEDTPQYFGTDRLLNMVTEMSENDMFRRLMFAVETCYSGKWGEALEGIEDVLVLTAASPYETSKADVHDRDLGVYLSNAFARTFRRVINANPQVSIYDLYKELARTTTGSHVNIYNNAQYGSVYTETMQDYFPN